MTFDAASRQTLLHHHAEAYVNLAIQNIEREYPYMPCLVVDGPGTLPSHRELHPVFYGSFDWHSCVEMYWTAVRLLQLFPNDTPQTGAREAISNLLTDEHIEVEVAFFANPAHRGFERPYGWGWLLSLQAELDRWDDPDGRRWATTLRPLSRDIAHNLMTWLPLLTYPQRTGVHQNTAFALLRSLDHAADLANAGEPTLHDALREAGLRFFTSDTDYPAHYEPSGADFLSAALSEAELMSRLLLPGDFAAWLDAFLPKLAVAQPAQLFTPAEVSDGSDGQIAHLAGLNLSRAAGFLAIANVLEAGDPRVGALQDAAAVHANASLGSVSGGDYMLEHWLAAYATLLLTT